MAVPHGCGNHRERTKPTSSMPAAIDRRPPGPARRVVSHRVGAHHEMRHEEGRTGAAAKVKSPSARPAASVQARSGPRPISGPSRRGHGAIKRGARQRLRSGWRADRCRPHAGRAAAARCRRRRSRPTTRLARLGVGLAHLLAVPMVSRGATAHAADGCPGHIRSRRGPAAQIPTCWWRRQGSSPPPVPPPSPIAWVKVGSKWAGQHALSAPD
jgi:hypothetical protein